MIRFKKDDIIYHKTIGRQTKFIVNKITISESDGSFYYTLIDLKNIAYTPLFLTTDTVDFYYELDISISRNNKWNIIR